MNKHKLVKIIEKFAPLEWQEKWDCSGWQIETDKNDIKRVMIALSVTEKVYKQAIENDCDMIVAHHPMFVVPIEFKNIDIYSAHTNMDKTLGGTTDTLVEALDLKATPKGEFLRISATAISVSDLAKKIKKISPNARMINNLGVKNVFKIGFCAGSGMDLYKEAKEYGCDCFITGDIKYHSAIDSDIVMFDVGHFDSEILIKKVFQGLIKDTVEVKIADEESPFKNI